MTPWNVYVGVANAMGAINAECERQQQRALRERAFNTRSTTVQRPFPEDNNMKNPMDFSDSCPHDDQHQGMADEGPLAGIELRRKDGPPGGVSWFWHFPGGGSRPASLTEVLLYEVNYNLACLSELVENLVPPPFDED